MDEAITGTSAMEKVQLGSSDLQVSVACIGTAPKARSSIQMMGSTNTEEEAHAQLDHFRSKGGNFITTAEVYPAPPTPEYVGHCEEIIGRWFKDRGCRDDFVVLTKVVGPMPANFCSGNRTEEFDEAAENPAVDRGNILAAVDGSLRRLQTDRIDILGLHWPARYVPIFGGTQFNPENCYAAASFEEQVKAIGELMEAGKIRHWALSNETAYGVTMMCETAKRLGIPLPIVMENDYSLCDRRFDLDTAEACHAYGIRLLPYGMLAGGFLSGKYLGGAKPEGARHTALPDFQPRYATAAMHEAAEKYKALAERKGMSLLQLAVAWVSSRWHVDAVITGQTKVEQMDEYLGAIGMQLDEETLEEVESIYRSNRNPSWSD